MERASKLHPYQIEVSLEDQTVRDSHGFSASFSIDPFRRECLLGGLDDIDLSLRSAAALDDFERRHDNAFWLMPRPAEPLNAQREG
jgi:3-isopropylmalate/(R)-2-methylmalate dehydratase small subunit